MFVVILGTVASQAASAADACDNVGNVKFVCIDGVAEDIVPVPNSDWVIVSGNLRAINTKTLEDVVLFSTIRNSTKKDTVLVRARSRAREMEHGAFAASGGLNLRPGEDGVHTLYMMHRLGGPNTLRSSIEVFEADFSGAMPRITWVGCMVHPRRRSSILSRSCPTTALPRPHTAARKPVAN